MRPAMSAPAAEQATVYAVAGDGSVSLLRDDGVLLDAPASAVAAGGWRKPRPGQRVSLRRQDGQITAVLAPGALNDTVHMDPCTDRGTHNSADTGQ